MRTLLRLAQCCRDNRAVYFAIWITAALGIVPAIVTEGILPFGLFSFRFGITIDEIVFLSANHCLVIFLLGLVACMAQRRLQLALLLLPWLALSVYDLEQLTYRLPAYSQAQEILRINYVSSRENPQAPQPAEIGAELDRIEFPQNSLMPIDIERKHEELKSLHKLLGKTVEKRPVQVIALVLKIAKLTSNIDAENNQIDKINDATGSTGLGLIPGFVQANESLKKQLEQAREAVITRRDRQVEKRSVLRAELDDSFEAGTARDTARVRLYELRAEVGTSLWASEAHKTWRFSQIFKTICLLVLLILIWRFSLSSWVFLFLLGVSTMISLFYVEAPLLFRLWVIVKLLAASLVIRALFRLAIENYPLLRRQSSAFLSRTLGKTLVYYWLFVALIAIGLVTSWQIERYIDRTIYSFKIMAEFEPGKHARRYDIDVAIDNYFAQKEAAVHAELNALLRENPLPGVGRVAELTNDLFAQAFEPTLPQMNATFKEPNCGGFLPWIFDTADCAEKGVKKPANNGYKEERDYYAGKLKKSTDTYSRKADTNTRKAVSIAKQDLHQNFLDLRLALKARLYLFYSIVDFIAWVSLLLFVLMILKSLLYIYSRLFFASNESDPGRAIQFEPTPDPVQCGSVREVAGTIKLKAKLGEWLYVHKDYDFANAPPDEVTPQALKAFFSRFASKAWHMNRIRTADKGNSKYAPYRRIPEDERIIVWSLKPGDAVIFSWRNFVGMNENVRIRTRFSWQLSSLVLGRMFYVVAFVEPKADGDGTLMLAARGSDGVFESSQPSTSPDQLLAWQTTTRFQLHANLSIRNIYRSGIQIRAVDSDLAVIHQDKRRQKSGAAAFLKYFLIPV